MDFAEQVKSSVDIVQVIGEHVQLKKQGVRYVGRCPFHSERTPSFSVHSVHQFYKCFGCGEGGDVFTFVQKIENISFYEALKMLADRHGIAMPKRDHNDPDIKRRAALYQMHEIAQEEFHRRLMSAEGNEAREYLKSRGVTKQMAEEFGLGLSDRNGQALTKRFEGEKFAPEDMEASSLVRRRDSGGGFYDAFRGRLMFPIHSESGKVIAFGGRALAAGDEPKYLNSSETAIYTKRNVLYNLNRAKADMRKNDRIILVEGYMDVIGVYGAGIHEVVASCGTSITPAHAKAMQRLTRNVILNLDADAAGARGSDKSIELFLREGLKIKVLELEGGLDPDEYIKQNGVDAYQRRLTSARDYFDWLAFRTREKFGGQDVRDRVAALEGLLPTIALVPNEVEKIAIAAQLAEFFGVETSYVYKHFRKSGGPARMPVSAAAVAPKTDVKPIERMLVNALLQSEEVRNDYVPALRTLHVLEGFRTRGILDAVFAIHENGDPVRYSTVEARLGEPDRALLAALVLTEQPGEAEEAAGMAQACMQALIVEERKWEEADLRQQIRDAERAGDIQKAMELIARLPKQRG